MKKIFTLMAAIMMAVGMNAETKSIGEPSNNTVDGENVWYDAATKTIHFLEAWSYRPGWWLAWDNDTQDNTGLDVSEFDEFVLEVENSTVNIQVVVEYMEGDDSKTIGKDQIVVKLSGAKVKQIYLQGAEVGTATFKAAYFQNAVVKEREDISLSQFGDATQNADGTATFTFANQWGWINIWYGTDTAADWSDYTELVAELAASVDFTAQLVVEYTDGTNDSGQAQPGETSMKVVLDATKKSAVKQIAIQNSEPGSVTLKSLYLLKAGSANAINAARTQQATGQRYNLSGQQVDASYKGIVIENGKKFVQK